MAPPSERQLAAGELAARHLALELAHRGCVIELGEIVARDERPAPIVTWTPATAVPQVPRNLDYAGTSNVVEFDDTMFVLFNFRFFSVSETRQAEGH